MAETINLENNLAISSETIQVFHDDLVKFRGEPILSLPDVTAFINHDGHECEPDLDFKAGLYLADQLRGSSKDNNSISDNIAFSVQPSHRLGREVSHNKVFFVNLTSEDNSDSQLLIDEHIAVKPIPKLAPLLGELAMFQYMQTVNIPTFQPVGALLSDKGPHHLLTRFEQPIDTMDTLDWKEMDYDEKLFQLRYAIDTAVLLHTKLLFHGDLEFKNVGFNEVGEIFVVDPEVMRSGADIARAYYASDNEVARHREVSKLSKRMSSDFTDICHSIDNFIFSDSPEQLKLRQDQAKFKVYKHHLFAPYREKIAATDSEHRNLLLEAYDLMLHAKKELAQGKNLDHFV